MLTAVTTIANTVVLLSVGYLLTVIVAGRRKRPMPDGSTERFTPVFLVPCLNEERVIGATLDRLLKIPRSFVMVVDDGSDDATAALVAEHRAEHPDRVLLVQRHAPDARRGKGAALNYGYNKLVSVCEDRSLEPHDVIVCVMDADGVIEVDAIDEVQRWFLDPKVAACQILVRIRNRTKLIGRLQDIEFTSFTELVQQGRDTIGSSGLGGNGQFTRMSALLQLGRSPWSDCLVEDLDLGLQLLARGWELRVCTTTSVGQQGLESVGRLVRQRTRWVQGLFQCWKRIPEILASPMRMRATLDVLYYLLFPGLVCIVWPVVVVTAHAWLLVGVLTSDTTSSLGNGRFYSSLAMWYLFTFGPSLFVVFHYKRRTDEISGRRSFLLAHALAAYQLVWYVAGWKAMARMVSGTRGWVKTERYVEDPRIRVLGAGAPDALIAAAQAAGAAPVGMAEPARSTLER